MKASAAIYFGVSAAERRRIAKQLKQAREKRDKALAMAERLRRQKPGWSLIREMGPTLGQALAQQIVGAQRVSVKLLACHLCGRPTPQCTCFDVDGQPLDWSVA